jgi:hypothetical protein
VSAAVTAVAAAVLMAAWPGGTGQAATGGSVPFAGEVSAVPAKGTPDIRDGAVLDLAQVGTEVVAGGTFTQAAVAKGATAQSRLRLLAFDAATGQLDAAFAPAVDGEVDAVEPGREAGTVLIGGTFTHVNGQAVPHVALLDLATGSLVPGFAPPAFNGPVSDLKVVGSRVLVGGGFWLAGTQARGGLASIDATTGALDGYATLAFTGHHNWGVQPGAAKGWVGVRRIAVSPDGTRAVVVGNFTKAGKQARDQIALLQLRPGSVSVDTSWATSLYNQACYYQLWDSFVDDVAFAPDGRFFVVTSTGGYGLVTVPPGCDSAARWDVGGTGTDVPPTWVAESGGDTLLSVAVTPTSVYVGGHMRWMNNFNGVDGALPGGVPRPGLAALDPASGVPQAWNPGRNPRGAGTSALLATSAGLYVGSDTTYIGNFAYYRGRVAFFPATGAQPAPAATAPNLPVRVCRGSDSGTVCRTFDGTTFGPAVPLADANPADWTGAFAAFAAGNTVYLADSTGALLAKQVGPSGLAASTVVDPYDDPAWANVRTGEVGGLTYRGLAPDLLTSQAWTLTAAFVDAGRLYVWREDLAQVAEQAFVPDSGVVEADEHHLPTPDEGGVDLGWAWGGSFVAGGQLYRVDQTGTMYAQPWADGTVSGSDVAVSGPDVDGINWLSPGKLFVLPGA